MGGRNFEISCQRESEGQQVLTAIEKGRCPNNRASGIWPGVQVSNPVPQIGFCGRISQAIRGSRPDGPGEDGPGEDGPGESEILSSFVKSRDWIEIQTRVPGRR
jgi:hypothetical protein